MLRVHPADYRGHSTRSRTTKIVQANAVGVESTIVGCLNPSSLIKNMPESKRSKVKFWAALGCGSLIILAAVSVITLFWLFTHRQDFSDQGLLIDSSTERTTRTTQTFVNSRAGLDGDRIAHYTDFSFQYPVSWRLDPNQRKPGQLNYVVVSRCLEIDPTLELNCDMQIEQFSVGPFWGPHQIQGDEPQLQDLLRKYKTQLERSIPSYQKVSEGKTQVGSYQGYEIRYTGKSRRSQSNGQDLLIWGRDVFLPDGQGNGVLLMTLATSLSSEIKSLEDVGVKGELPILLKSFRFTSPRSKSWPGFLF